MAISDVLVFGEDTNDRQALAHLTKALHPDSTFRITQLRRPIILARNAADRKRRNMAEEIAGFSKAYEKAGKDVVVIVHRDCDDVEPNHVSNAQDLKDQLSAAGVKLPVPATPAWEIETWWMLFPGAVGSISPKWRKIDYGTQHVGQISNSKERLTRDLRPTDKTVKSRDFEESDGPKIAQILVKEQQHLLAVKARSDSFVAFKEALDDAINPKLQKKK